MPLNKQVTTVFLTYVSLGGYLKDRKNIEEAFTSDKVDDIQQALDTLLQNLIIEAKAIDEIKSFSLDTAKNRITESHDECVKERMGIEAAQAAEDILQAASVAAQIALVAVSWTVFGTIGLGIAALAAEIAAEGTAEGVKALENTITQSISDMGLKAYNDPALANVKVFHDSSDQVSVNIAKLELAGNRAIIRQALLGLAKVSGTLEEMKKNLIHFYEVSEKPDDIIGKYTLLAELMLKGDGGPAAEKIILDLKESGLAPIIIKTVILTVMATGLGLSFQVMKFTKEIARLQNLGVLTLAETTTLAELPLKSEKMVKTVKGLAVLGAALEAGFLGWKIYEQRKLIDYINAQIEDRKNKLIEYYTNFHEAVTSPTVSASPTKPTDGTVPGGSSSALNENAVFKVSGETCPSGSTLVAYEEALANKDLLSRKLGTWDIARLANGGSMDGPGYDSKIRPKDERGLGHALCKRL